MPSIDDSEEEDTTLRRTDDEDDDDDYDDDDDDAEDLSDLEFHQKRVLDWAEERVSISEADLGADLEHLLKSCSAAVDESPSTRRLRMRQSPGVGVLHGRTSSEASSTRISLSAASTGSGEDYGCGGSSTLSWRHNSGGDASSSYTPAARSPWNSVENTPDPRNRR